MQDKREKTVEKLLFDIPRRFMSRAFQELMRQGLHPGQIPVMKYLSENSGCIQGEIARALHIKPPTVTVTLKRLEKNGFVEKRSDEKDQRVTRIFLTERGMEVYKKMIQSYYSSVDLIMKGFSEEETEQLQDYLNRVCDNIDNIFADCTSMKEYAEEGEETC